MTAGEEHPARAAPAPEIVEERRVADIETLRILADPLRLAILGALPVEPASPPMSVKEIAELLDEGQTKLYRHVKQLEESGLIHVAQTRVVSGIIEKRYRASQRRLSVGGVLHLPHAADDYNDALASVLDATRATLAADLRAGRVVLNTSERGADLGIKMGATKTRMTTDQYVRIRKVLAELFEELETDAEGPDTFPVVLQALLYTTEDPPAQNTENPPSTKSS
jgi:DNA-binding transcriptional ArsR family regulator